jgi:hypothetical protein
MSSLHVLLAPVGQSLTERLQRLHATLEGLGERLRDAVARAVGQTVAEAVREAVLTLLADGRDRPGAPGPPQRPSPQPPSVWDAPDDVAWPEERDPVFRPADEGWEADAARRAPRPAPTASPVVRGGRALAWGCRAAAWWLRRRAGRRPLLVALSVGVLTAVAAYAGGTLAVAGAGVAGTAVSLLALADAVGSGSAALASFATS